MKKYFLLATMAVVAVALVSCGDKKKDEEPTPEPPTQEVKVVLSDNELDLPQGYKYQLAATITPAKSLAITWTSTDENVAPVDEDGYVYGVAYGTAKIIASAEGAKSDTCVVTVYDPLTRYEWAGMTLWGFDLDSVTGERIVMSEDTVEIELQGGLKVHCITVSSQFRLWGEGIEFVETATGGYLAGAGSMAVLTNVPTWIITDSLDARGPNYYYVSTTFEIVDPAEYDPKKAENAWTAPYGELKDLAQHVQWYEDETGTVEPGITGATIYYANLDEKKYYPFDGLMGPGLYQGDETEIQYKGYVAWSDGIFGFALNAEGTNLKQPYEFAKYTQYLYSNVAASAPMANGPRTGRQASAKELKVLRQNCTIKADRDIKGFRANR